MRKLLIIASLSALAFMACKGGSNSTNNTGDTTAAGEFVGTGEFSIAYVNMDSLISKFDMYKDLRAKYEEKAQKVEKELTNKGRSFERAVADYQEKVQKGLVTRSQAAQIEEDLERQQNSFISYRDNALEDLGEEEAVMMNQIQHSIVEYVKELNADKKYSMILYNTASGPIIDAVASLDITSQVLEGVNKKYTSAKPAK